MSNLGGMTDGQAFRVVGFAFFFMLAYLADIYTTFCGLSEGFVEGNPLMRWAFKKMDKALASFIGGTVVLFIGGFLTNYGWGAASLYFGIVGAGESVIALRNYRKLKAAKISLK